MGNVTLPRIMQDGKTPAQWVDELGRRGVDVSERTLRERARHLGACRMLGNAMILLPEHIDTIFEEPTCLNRTSEGASGGSVDTLLMATNTSERALAHLTKLSRKPPSVRSKRRPANVVSLDPMRRSNTTN